MKTPIKNVAPLMPHSGKMILISEIIAYDNKSLSAYADVSNEHIFVQDAILPAWTALEFMAQGIAAWAGCLAHDHKEPVRLGFLLGTRKLQLYFNELVVPCRLRIEIAVSLQDEQGFGVFDCSLYHIEKNEQLLAEGALNVYSPKDEALVLNNELVNK